MQLNLSISNSQGKREIVKIADRKCLKGKSNGNDFEFEITGNWKNPVAVSGVQLHCEIFMILTTKHALSASAWLSSIAVNNESQISSYGH